MSQLVIDIQNVEVYYKFEKDKSTTLKEFTIRLLSKKIALEKIKALDGVSMQINPGETFGVIGRNGAGKSTLLKLISGIVRPTKGRVLVWGNIRSLLSVGAGFNPELTGRENIFMYSSMLGRSDNETKALLEEIIDFSEIEKFIDSPVRIYSTGMIARLGFSIAMVNLPEIILIDEVLAVGDAAFREKCMKRLNEFRTSGATVVFVSHSMKDISQLCQRVAWLREGKVIRIGTPDEVVPLYENFYHVTKAN
jgi:ABC-2 type transport system ATP-binding protein/lipopolysaccharide transport system ATP-binding protein